MKTQLNPKEGLFLKPSIQGIQVISFDQKLKSMHSGLEEAVNNDILGHRVNEAKLRAVSQHASWDQFNGMVLTAHLEPVNLKSQPLDKLYSPPTARNQDSESSISHSNSSPVLGDPDFSDLIIHAFRSSQPETTRSKAHSHLCSQ